MRRIAREGRRSPGEGAAADRSLRTADESLRPEAAPAGWGRGAETRIWKQFTARDRFSRWDVLELRRNATASTAAGVLDALDSRMRSPIRAISVDNGSEFEAACAARAIALLTLPARSPTLHGTVERANRTHTEEFYEVTSAEPELETFAKDLRAWETVYNTVRPHQARGYLTPAEFLASLGIDM